MQDVLLIFGVKHIETRTKQVETIRNIKIGLAFPILSVIMPVTEQQRNWKTNIIENTDESSTSVTPRSVMKILRKILGRLPAAKRKLHFSLINFSLTKCRNIIKLYIDIN